MLLQGFLVNIALFVFNALPIPGLDGYAVVRSLLFGVAPRVFLYLEQYRYVIYALAALAALLPPPLTHGAVDAVAAMTVGTASLTVRPSDRARRGSDLHRAAERVSPAVMSVCG